MKFEMLFSIGELAKICSVTPKTLRHYDKLDLLKPASVNPQNGYRFYTKWHITRVSTIRLLQEVGLSLDHIRNFFTINEHTDVIESLSELLETQEMCLIQHISALNDKLNLIRTIQRQYSTIKQDAAVSDSSSFTFRKFPQRKIVYTSYHGPYTANLHRTIYQKLLADLKNTGHIPEKIIYAGPLAVTPSSNYDSRNTDLLLGYEIGGGATLPLPTLLIDPGLYACRIYKGSYSESYNEFQKQIRAELKALGYVTRFPQIQYFHVNESVTDYVSNYLTEIQMPVKLP